MSRRRLYDVFIITQPKHVAVPTQGSANEVNKKKTSVCVDTRKLRWLVSAGRQMETAEHLLCLGDSAPSCRNGEESGGSLQVETI